LDAFRRRDESQHGNLRPLDQAQEMSGEIHIEHGEQRDEMQLAGLAEALELARRQARERDRLGELLLALLRVESVLVELKHVLKQPGRARKPASIRRILPAQLGAQADERFPVVGFNEARDWLLPLECELVG